MTMRWGGQAASALMITTLCLGPATAGPPFRTDDPEPVEDGHWEVYGFSTGTHAAGDTAAIAPGIEVNYGAAPDLQLHIIAPLSFDAPPHGATQVGPGDTELGAKYRFIEEDDDGWRPQVGIFPLLELPSGNARRALGTGRVHAFLPLWLQKSIGDWTSYGGGGYWINPGPGNKNYLFVGWLLQRKLAEDFVLGGEIFHQTANVTGGRESTGVNVGGIYDFTENYHLLFSIGRGVQNAPTTNDISYYLAVQWTY